MIKTAFWLQGRLCVPGVKLQCRFALNLCVGFRCFAWRGLNMQTNAERYAELRKSLAAGHDGGLFGTFKRYGARRRCAVTAFEAEKADAFSTLCRKMWNFRRMSLKRL